jgi:WD40 repeat protein
MPQVWDIRTGEVVKKVPAHRRNVTSLEILPQIGIVVSTSLDGSVKV